MSKKEKINLNILNKKELLQELNKNYILSLQYELKLKEASFREIAVLKAKRNTFVKTSNKILAKLTKFDISLTIEDIRSNKISILEL